MNILGVTTKPSDDMWGLFAVGVAGAITVSYVRASADPQHYDLVANTLASVSATLLGFVLTAVTILGALSKTRLLSNMYRTGHAKHLLDELFGSVIVFLFVLIFAMIAIFLSPKAMRSMDLAWSYFILGVYTLISGGTKFYSVMIALGRPTPKIPAIAQINDDGE